MRCIHTTRSDLIRIWRAELVVSMNSSFDENREHQLKYVVPALLNSHFGFEYSGLSLAGPCVDLHMLALA